MSAAISAICFTLLFSAITMLNLFAKDSNNFGPYDLRLVEYELCKGPKTHNLTFTVTNLTEKGGDLIGHFNVTYLEVAKFEEIKITVHSIKGNTKNLLWTYKVNDPCKHFAFGSLIKIIFKSEKCVVSKGSYYFTQNFNEITKTFMGSSFFYGDFLLKATTTSKKGNILCIVVLNRFTKKT